MIPSLLCVNVRIAGLFSKYAQYTASPSGQLFNLTIRPMSCMAFTASSLICFPDFFVIYQRRLHMTPRKKTLPIPSCNPYLNFAIRIPDTTSLLSVSTRSPKRACLISFFTLPAVMLSAVWFSVFMCLPASLSDQSYLFIILPADPEGSQPIVLYPPHWQYVCRSVPVRPVIPTDESVLLSSVHPVGQGLDCAL